MPGKSATTCAEISGNSGLERSRLSARSKSEAMRDLGWGEEILDELSTAFDVLDLPVETLVLG